MIMRSLIDAEGDVILNQKGDTSLDSVNLEVILNVSRRKIGA